MVSIGNILQQYHRSTEVGNRDGLVSSLYSYVSTAFSVSTEELQLLPWYEITRAFKEIYQINIPSINFPMLRKRIKKETNEEIGWEYPGRTWYVWLHLLANEYGWNINYIEHLDIDDGIALLQEILVNDQLNKEWEWSRSEFAYSYNQNTKTSKFIPLERPEWMRRI